MLRSFCLVLEQLVRDPFHKNPFFEHCCEGRVYKRTFLRGFFSGEFFETIRLFWKDI